MPRRAPPPKPSSPVQCVGAMRFAYCALRCHASPSTSRRLLIVIPRDSPLEVVVFFAADETDVFQVGEVLLGRGWVAENQIGLAEMLVGAAMARIEHQRLLVVSDRRPDLAQPPIGIANVVLDVGVARIA